MIKLKTVCFYIFLWLFKSYLAHAQLYNTNDSAFLASMDLEKRANLLYDLCWKHRADSPFLAIEYGNKAYLYFEKLNLPCKQSEVLNKLGIVKRNLGQYSLARDNFAKAISIADSETCLHQKAYAYNNLGDINEFSLKRLKK